MFKARDALFSSIPDTGKRVKHRKVEDVLISSASKALDFNMKSAALTYHLKGNIFVKLSFDS